MRLVKNIGLVTTVCILLGTQVVADDIDTKDMVSIESSEPATINSFAPKRAPVNEMTIPNTFTANTPAVADEVNANFVAAKTAVDDNSAELEKLKALVSGMAKYAMKGVTSPFIGVPQGVVEADGWSVCFSEPFDGASTSLTTILSQECTGANLMLACRPIGDDTFTVAAYAPRDDVTFDTTTDRTTTHLANGTEWYFNYSRSWGFAAAGVPVQKQTCDTDGTDAEHKMCMHTSDGVLSPGWRCGTNTGVNSGWERVILEK